MLYPWLVVAYITSNNQLIHVKHQCFNFYSNSNKAFKYVPDKKNEVEKDGAGDYGERAHFRENCRSPGYIIYTVSYV